MPINTALEPKLPPKTTFGGTPLKKRIYIAGRVTGLNYSEVLRKFQHAENYLHTLGFTVINPTKLIGEDCPWQDAMRSCIRDLCTADAIYMLKDYYQSRGAMLEHMIAISLDMAVIHEF